jgi:hypothetical protein
VAADTTTSAAPQSTAPFHNALFCRLWIAGLVSKVGMFMHTVGAG